jgi:hypothetical protein
MSLFDWSVWEIGALMPVIFLLGGQATGFL